jgi:hypothetical protein
METRLKTGQGQLGLFPEEANREDLRLPEAINTELVKVLAGLLLEAAGVARNQGDGGGDESEDHA